MLTERQAAILSIVVREYVVTAVPVGSETIAKKNELAVSAATIRNEMADLENEGYIRHPHTSAGRVPSDKGYRYFVEHLMGERELPLSEQRTIRHQFHQVEFDPEEWARLASAVLARSLHNAAIVSLPAANKCRIKQLQLISIHETLALLVLVLQEGTIRQQMVSLPEQCAQEDLTTLSNRLNATLSGLTSGQVSHRLIPQTPFETVVVESIDRLMEAADRASFAEIYLDGLRNILGQPEFGNSGRVRRLVEALENRSSLQLILLDVLGDDGVKVIIGNENRDDAMHDCTVVLARYGLAGEAVGAAGVLGPTRMEYSRVVPVVRYVTSILSEIMREMHG